MTSTSMTENRRFLGYFLSGVIISTIMLVGFAKNYYLRAWIGTRPITAMVHVHGLVMTTWIVLFLTQTILVARRRVDLHRKLGVAGAFLAFIVVTLGIYTISNSIFRFKPGATLPFFAHFFVAFDGLSVLLFGGLVITALVMRSQPQIHKRLMLMALVSLLPPAFGRFVGYFTHIGVEGTVLAMMIATVLSCILVDTVRHRRLNWAFAWSSGLIVAVNTLTYFAQTTD